MRSALENLTQFLRLPGSQSKRRLELLHRLTDSYVQEPSAFDDRQTEDLGDMLSTLAREMEVDVRRTLAERIARLPVAPRSIVLELANDEISVAGPILQDSIVLTDADLVALARIVGQRHLAAIARRARVSSVVSEAVAQRADADALVELAGNAGADLSRPVLEIMIARAAGREDLGRLLVLHPQIPPDLLNGLYFIVSTALRRVIVERTSDLDPAVVEDALRESERRLRSRFGTAVGAKGYGDEASVTPAPNESDLVALARSGRLRQLAVALSKFANLAVETTERVLGDADNVGLAVVCRACRLQLSTFTALAVRRGDTSSNVPSLIPLYQKLSPETAARLLRFWRVREATLSPMTA